MTCDNPSTLERAAELLRIAANLRRLEFYAWQHDRKPAEIRCRIFEPTCPSLGDAEQLVQLLNEAMQPVLRSAAAGVEAEAKRLLDGDAA
jgi:hypothetical protein